MLNEIKEFEQYTFPLNSVFDKLDCRLKYANMFPDFSGLDRALTIIARWYIFKDGKDRSNFNEENTKEVLKTWCGFHTDKALPEITLLKDWLPNYIKVAFLKEKLQVCIDTLAAIIVNTKEKEVLSLLKSMSFDDTDKDLIEKMNVLEKIEKTLDDGSFIKKDESLKAVKKIIKGLEALKNKRFNENMFSLSYQYLADLNNYKKITYDRIIANALNIGKLEQYYLVCGTDPFKTKLISKATKEKTTKTLNATDKDIILKITALYLLRKRRTTQNYVEFNKVDMANWLPKLDNKLEKLDKYKFGEKLETLFLFDTIGRSKANRKNNNENRQKGGNVTKVRIHDEWIKIFSVVPAQNIDNPEYIGKLFYSDLGSAHYLEEGKGIQYNS